MADTLSPSQELLKKAQDHFDNKNNPHKVNHKQIYELWNVENTSDADKPVSKVLQSELDKKVNISDLYNDSKDDGTGKDLTKIPWTAVQGKVLSETIDNVSNPDTTAISNRITAIENILING